jgi:hypothetical protein
VLIYLTLQCSTYQTKEIRHTIKKKDKALIRLELLTKIIVLIYELLKQQVVVVCKYYYQYSLYYYSTIELLYNDTQSIVKSDYNIDVIEGYFSPGPKN